MAFYDLNTPRRARFPLAGFVTKLRRKVQPRPGFPKTLSDHLARDVGLTAHDLEKLRFEWPSDGPDRPLI